MKIRDIDSLDKIKIEAFPYNDGEAILGHTMIKIIQGYRSPSPHLDTISELEKIEIDPYVIKRLSNVFFGMKYCPDCKEKMKVDSSFVIQLFSMAANYLIKNNLIVEGEIIIPTTMAVCEYLSSEEVALFCNVGCRNCGYEETIESVVKEDIYQEQLNALCHFGMEVREDRRADNNEQHKKAPARI